MSSPLPIAVLLSGSGRTLANLLEKIEREQLPVRVVAVASDREAVRGLEIAESAAIPVRVFPKRQFGERVQRDAEMLRWLRSFGPELICLAGYLSLLDLQECSGLPVLNIHPALLPAYGGKGYYGDKVHAAVLESGERTSGATVHLVNEHFDEGAILARIEVPVRADDEVATLAARIFEAECELYPTVLRWYADGVLRVQDGKPMGTDGAWEPRRLRVGA